MSFNNGHTLLIDIVDVVNEGSVTEKSASTPSLSTTAPDDAVEDETSGKYTSELKSSVRN